MWVLLCIQIAVIWIAITSCGLSASFPAIIIPAFHDKLTPTQVSLVGTLRQTGIMVGSFFVGPLLDMKGRRKGLLFSFLPGILGYLIITLSETLTAICTGLLLEGIAMGMINAAASVFFAEALSKEWRGSIGVTRHVALSVGITLTYVFGLIFKGQIQTVALIALIFPSISLILGFGVIKETKIWLEQWKNSSEKKKKTNNFQTTYFNFFKALKNRPEVYKPFVILNTLNFLRHLSGAGVISNYTINIIVDSGATTDPYVVAIILGVFRTVGGIIGVIMSKFYGRRIVMNTAAVCMTISMFAVSFIHLSGSSFKYIPEIFLALFISTAVIFQSTTLSLQGELFPTEFRGMCSSTSSTVSNLSGSLVLFAYPLLKYWLGNGLIMMSYGLACIGCFLMTFFIVPTPDGKSLNEIGLMFKKQTRVMDDMNEVTNLKERRASNKWKRDSIDQSKEEVGR